VFLRDIGQMWRLATMAWMFLSPVFWDRSVLAKDHAELVQWVSVLNPAFALLEVHRLALGLPAERFGEFWPQLGIAAAWAFGFLVVGYSVFMSRKHRYSDLI
jgi:ABC-type polysaccharide/polyol phosphate export permease